MKCISNEVEFRGMETKSFIGDNGDPVSMTVLRFDDEEGLQNEFYIRDPNALSGFQSLVRGALFCLEISVGKNNKVKLLQIIER